MPRKIQWCKYFFSKEGRCDKEDRCGFMHSESDYDKPAPPTEEQIAVCGQFRTNGTCRLGAQCSL